MRSDGADPEFKSLHEYEFNRRHLFRLAAAGVGGVAPASHLWSRGRSAAAAQSEGAAGQRIVRIGHEREVSSNIDPHINQGQPIYVLENMYQPLAYPAPGTTELEPVLAESWEISEDGRVVTFRLRENVEFHDGTILDSAAVKASFERLMTIGLAYAQAELNQFVSEIRTPDERTVEFQIEPGGAPFLAVQTGVLIASTQAIEENTTSDDPNAQEFFALNAVGTGPYRLEELRPKDRMSITKFENYWGGWDGPHVDGALWLQIPEGATQALMLEQGELDVSFIVPLQSVPLMATDPRFQVIQERGTYLFYFRMSTEGGPLENKTLRKAFAHAFDYDTFIAVRQDYLPPEGPIASQFVGGWVPDNLPTYDIERAKALYAEAGYGPDNPVSVTQAIVTAADYQQTAAEIMQQGLAQLGVEYIIEQSQFAPVREGLRRWIQTGDESGFVDMFTLRMPANIPDPVAQLTAYRSEADLNLMGYSNPEVDALLEEALTNPDEAARIETYKEIATIIVEDQPDIWLGVERRTIVMNSALQGFYQHPLWWPGLFLYPLHFAE